MRVLLVLARMANSWFSLCVIARTVQEVAICTTAIGVQTMDGKSRSRCLVLLIRVGGRVNRVWAQMDAPSTLYERVIAWKETGTFLCPLRMMKEIGPKDKSSLLISMAATGRVVPLCTLTGRPCIFYPSAVLRWVHRISLCPPASMIQPGQTPLISGFRSIVSGKSFRW